MLTVATFASDDAFISVYLSAAIVMASLVLHMYLWPYAERLLNWLTAMVLGCVLGTQYLSLLYWYASQWSVPITVTLLLLNGATALTLVAALLRASLPRKKLCRLLRRGRRRRLQALGGSRPPPVGASDIIMLAHVSGGGNGNEATAPAGGLPRQPVPVRFTAWTDNPLGVASAHVARNSPRGSQQEEGAAR